MPEGIVIALISLFSGGLATALLKILEKFLNKAKDESDYDSEIRTELRLDLDRRASELANLRDQISILTEEAQSWKVDYWALYEVFFQLKLMGQVMAQDSPELKTKIDLISAPHERQTKARHAELVEKDK